MCNKTTSGPVKLDMTINHSSAVSKTVLSGNTPPTAVAGMIVVFSFEGVSVYLSAVHFTSLFQYLILYSVEWKGDK
jgi:hypothetical protein